MTAVARDRLMRLLATILRPCQQTSTNDRPPNIPAAQASRTILQVRVMIEIARKTGRSWCMLAAVTEKPEKTKSRAVYQWFKGWLGTRPVSDKNRAANILEASNTNWTRRQILPAV